MKFNELKIQQEIVNVLIKKGYKEASPIQEKAIPIALQGKDILGCAQTGTGKTAAFAIPTLQLLKEHNKNYVRALVLTPTRELAVQIQQSFQEYGKDMHLKSTCIFGGVKQSAQERALKSGMDIIVATPGRLNDFIQQGLVDLSKLKILILDEADRMLDMGFLNDVKRITSKTPNKKQSLLFSATMPNDIGKLAKSLLKNPAYIEVSPVSSTVDKIEQSLYHVDKSNKKKLLLDLIHTQNVFSALVFTRTKVNANRLAKYLNANGVLSDAIHGDKTQNARQRALSAFKSSKIQVLVATDIAARGIDVSELEFVFNYEIPNESESYVHRIGRTARAGLSGKAISLCDINEKAYIKNIEKVIGKEIPVVQEHDYPMQQLIPTIKSSNRTQENFSKNRDKTKIKREKTTKSKSPKLNKNQAGVKKVKKTSKSNTHYNQRRGK